MLAAMSKESFRGRFSIATVRDKYGERLAVAVPGVVNAKERYCRRHSCHDCPLYGKCRMMLLLLPITYQEILVGFNFRLRLKIAATFLAKLIVF